jgi:methyl-accepting chemotaxis protein
MIERIKLDGINIGPKIILSFVVVAFLVGVTGAVGYYSVGTVDEKAHLVADNAEKMDATSELTLGIEKQQEAILYAQLGQGKKAEELFTEGDEQFKSGIETLQSKELSPPKAAKVRSIKRTHEEYGSVATKIFEATQAGNIELAAQKAPRAEEIGTQIKGDAAGLKAQEQGALDQRVAAADSTAQTAKMELIGLTLIAFIIAIILGLFVTKRITDPITQLSDAATAGSNGDLSIDVDDHVENDELGQMIDAFSEMQTNLRTIFDDLEDVSNGLATGQFERNIDTAYPGTYGQLMTNLDAATDQLDDSFTEIQRASERLSEQNLDQSIETDKVGRYGTVLESLEEGVMEMNESLTTVQEIADDVAESSEETATTAEAVDEASQEVAASVEEVQQASEEVAESVQKISVGAESQSNDLRGVADEMNDMSATVEEIASSAEEVSMTAQTAVERSQEGQQYASEATEEISAIESQADEAAAQVKTLDHKMEEISEIVDLITNIAEQTNLLALNASIEAARAGEAGEGFAVVADEIKSLAEDVSEATTEIESQIDEIQSTTTETVEGMETMTERVDRGSETIEDAIEKFDEIAQAVSEAESGVEEISTATDDQAASSQEVVAMVDDVASVSEQTATEASSVSAATEEQTSSLAAVSDTAEELSRLSDSSTAERLSELSETLRKEVAQFDLENNWTSDTDHTMGVETPSVPAGPSAPTETHSASRAQTDGGESGLND